MPASSRPQTGTISAANSPLVVRGVRLLVAVEREGVLLFARDALRLGEELGSDAHHQRALAGAREELGIEVDAGVHRDVVHVLQAADDLHVFRPGEDRMRRLSQRLQTAAAQAIDGCPARFDRQFPPSSRPRGRR